jgi:hypothetical protein
MLENENEKKIPEVEFTFRKKENMSEEERKKKFEELLRKRNEFFISMGLSIPSTEETDSNEMSNDYPRRTR